MRSTPDTSQSGWSQTLSVSIGSTTAGGDLCRRSSRRFSPLGTTSPHMTSLTTSCPATITLDCLTQLYPQTASHVRNSKHRMPGVCLLKVILSCGTSTTVADTPKESSTEVSIEIAAPLHIPCQESAKSCVGDAPQIRNHMIIGSRLSGLPGGHSRGAEGVPQGTSMP